MIPTVNVLHKRISDHLGHELRVVLYADGQGLYCDTCHKNVINYDPDDLNSNDKPEAKPTPELPGGDVLRKVDAVQLIWHESVLESRTSRNMIPIGSIVMVEWIAYTPEFKENSPNAIDHAVIYTNIVIDSNDAPATFQVNGPEGWDIYEWYALGGYSKYPVQTFDIGLNDEISLD